MELVSIYACLCDRTRLRILHLLRRGPLCVCHLQETLGEPQVKISKHLAYLKTRGLVSVRQEANWRIYSLAARPSRALQAILACLQDCAQEEKVFRGDLARLAVVQREFGTAGPECCAPAAPRRARAKPASRR